MYTEFFGLSLTNFNVKVIYDMVSDVLESFDYVHCPSK